MDTQQVGPVMTAEERRALAQQLRLGAQTQVGPVMSTEERRALADELRLGSQYSTSAVRGPRGDLERQRLEASARPMEMPDLDTLAAGLSGVTDTMSLGFGDEIISTLRSLTEDIDYDTALEEYRYRDEQLGETNPLAYMGGQFAGGVLPLGGAATAGSKAGRALMPSRPTSAQHQRHLRELADYTTGSRFPVALQAPTAAGGIAGTTAAGAVGGGLYGFGSGEGFEDRLQEAGIGAGIGAAVPVAASGFGRAAQQFLRGDPLGTTQLPGMDTALRGGAVTGGLGFLAGMDPVGAAVAGALGTSAARSVGPTLRRSADTVADPQGMGAYRNVLEDTAVDLTTPTRVRTDGETYTIPAPFRPGDTVPIRDSYRQADYDISPGLLGRMQADEFLGEGIRTGATLGGYGLATQHVGQQEVSTRDRIREVYRNPQTFANRLAENGDIETLERLIEAEQQGFDAFRREIDTFFERPENRIEYLGPRRQ